MRTGAHYSFHILPAHSSPAPRLVVMNSPDKTTSLQLQLIWLKYVLKSLLYMDLVLSIASFTLSIHHALAVTLVSTGLFAVLASTVVKLTTIKLRSSKNWLEICAMTLCSLYASFFAFWVASNSLLGLIPG